MTDIFILTHAKNSTAGTIPDWCAQNYLNHRVLTAEEFVAEPLPTTFGGLIICGGDMEAWEVDDHPWLNGEKAIIKEAIGRSIPVFGICLGSQLLAEQLGAKVEPTGRWELGWFPVKFEDQTLTPFHCHRSRFTDIPGAETTARNAHQTNQAFKLGIHRGIQFHIEIDATRMQHIIENVGNPTGGYIQPKSEFMSSFETNKAPLKNFCFNQLTSWWQTAKKE